VGVTPSGRFMSAPEAITTPTRSSFLTPLSIALTSRLGLMLVVYLGLTLTPGRSSSERCPEASH